MSGTRPWRTSYEQNGHCKGFVEGAGRVFGETAMFRRGVEMTFGLDAWPDDADAEAAGEG